MTEISSYWGSTTPGDAGPYTDDDFSDIWRKLFQDDRDTEGVIKDYANELEVTGAATPVSVATGAALVDGKFYESDAVETVAISTPAGDTRVDRIVLRKDWTAQTVRITKIEGTEGAGAPALTQSDGSEWDIPLAQASITTGGVITVTDDRSFIKLTASAGRIPLWPALTAYAPLSGITAAGLETNESSDGGTIKPLLPEIRFDAAADEGRMFVFQMPEDYGGGLTANGIYKMESAQTTDTAEINIQLAAVSDGDASMSAKAFGTINAEDESVPDTADEADAFSFSLSNDDSVAAGDWVCLVIWIDASDSTFADDFILESFELRYNKGNS